jgi:hypothetical protein
MENFLDLLKKQAAKLQVASEYENISSIV